MRGMKRFDSWAIWSEPAGTPPLRGPSIQTTAFDASAWGDLPFTRTTRPTTEPAEPAARGPKATRERAKMSAPTTKTRAAMRVFDHSPKTGRLIIRPGEIGWSVSPAADACRSSSKQAKSRSASEGLEECDVARRAAVSCCHSEERSDEESLSSSRRDASLRSG